MKKAIVGKKVGMTQMFLADGTMIPVTVVEAGPCPVVQKKTVEHDGYNAVQVGFMQIREKPARKADQHKGSTSAKWANKPKQGHFDKAGVKVTRYLRELKLDDAATYEVGAIITADVFAEGERVDVVGTSKGKGFAGAIKRHNQARGRKTHGSHSYRVPGAMSACSDPSRVFKSKKLPGHMGAETVTIQNLEIVRVDKDRNLLLVKGAIPGAKGGMVVVKSTVKN